MRSSSLWTLCGVLATSMNGVLASQPPLLNIDSGSLTAGTTASGVQDIQLDAVQRGVTVGGGSRVFPLFGWALQADGSAADEIGARMLGPIDLLTGAVAFSDSQLVLPAVATWPIGVSYNNAQTAGHVSAGIQGNNWFQSSQPSVTAPDSNGVVRVVYSANAFAEYKRVDSTSYYAGTNGAGGVLHISSVVDSETTIELYTLLDQAGSEIVFFGFSGTLNGASGQLWKHTVAKGTATPDDAVAYVYDSVHPYGAMKYGYDSGHIVTAFDSAGHKFDYAYTTTAIAGVKRLTSVTATTGGSSPSTIATVEYAYYDHTTTGSGRVGNTTTNNGSDGDLALVRVTFPTSFPAVGADPAIQDVRENRFYYESQSRLKLVLGYEGTRSHLVATSGSPVSWDASSTTLATALNNRAELRVTYNTDTPPRIASAWFAGMDGSGTDSPAGQHSFTYENNAGSITTWNARTIVQLPAFTRAQGSNLGTLTETSNSTYLTQYFDSLGQPMSTVASDIAPGTSGAKYWVTTVVRDSSHRLSEVHTPAGCSGYTHTTTSAGAITLDATHGVGVYYERSSAGNVFDNLVTGVRRGNGTTTPNYVSATDWTKLEQTLATGTPTVKLTRPLPDIAYVYPVATATRATPSAYNFTDYDYTGWGSTVVLRSVKTTLPAIAAAHNGVGSSYYRQTWFTHLGQALATRMPNKRLDTSEYDATTGLLIRQVTDAETPTSSFAHYADVIPSGSGGPQADTFAGQSAANAYKIATEYQHDLLGRITETTANPSFSIGLGKRVSRTYYSRLTDRRIVRMDVPAVDTTGTATYYGPVSVSVVNHSGVTEEGGQISLASPTSLPTSAGQFTTTASPRTWLAEPGTGITQRRLAEVQAGNTAANSAALVSLRVQLTSPDGSRVVESRSYTRVPTSGSGTGGWLGDINTTGNNHEYDRSLVRYNGIGLVDRTQDVTNTIELPSFDVLGRVVQRRRGTVESGTGANMRVYASAAYDATTYGTYSGTNLNIAGGDGQVTQLFQHPSGAYGGGDDIHSFMRYDPLGNPTNVWRDGGPFLASTVDNLDRVTTAAAFNGSLSSWNSTPVDISGITIPTGMSNLLRYARSNYDEQGRIYKQENFAVDPIYGTISSSSADTVSSNTWFNPNGLVKATDTQQLTRNRICQVTVQATVARAPGDSQSQVAQNTELITSDYAHAVVISQTNAYFDPTHTVQVATVHAERGSADVTSGGVETTAPDPFEPLLDIPNTGQNGWMDVHQSGATLDNLEMILRSRTSGARLLLDVNTTKYDGLLMVPVKQYHLGDPLRHPGTTTPSIILCCGLTGCGAEPYTSLTYPYIEEKLDYDPRLVWSKVTTTDVESGDVRTVARRLNPAGQITDTVRARTRVTPTAGETPSGDTVAIPPLGTEAPAGLCCGEMEHNENTWDKGRIKLERMFLCDPPESPSTFNPNGDSAWSGCSNGCSKDTTHGYPDMIGWPSATYPGTHGPQPYDPNDNHLEMWNVKPIGGSPDLGWKSTPDPAGVDNTDWYVYDYLGRKVRDYRHAFRDWGFGDQHPASDIPARIYNFGTGGAADYPTEILTPSGDVTKPWEHQYTELDYLGRPKHVYHLLGAFSPSTPDYDDKLEYSYDKFGKISNISQWFKGMFPTGCSGTGWIDLGIVREGTPQQPTGSGINPIRVGGNKITPWQGPRVVRNTLPYPNLEVGMAYFPDPSGFDDNSMYPPGGGWGGGGYVPLMIEPRLDWALGRPEGLYEGDGTNHYNIPISQYATVGMAVPFWRFMADTGGGLQQWEFLPITTGTDSPPKGVAPGGRYGTGGGGFVPLEFHPPDWRHRIRDDPWWRPIDVNPSDIPYTPALWAETDGHQDIRWVSGHITSYLDRATSPGFISGSSPVSGFDIFGHDEFYRHDCNGRMIYWLSGQAFKWNKGPAETAYLAGLSSPVGTNSADATRPTAITHADFRWQGAPGSGTSGANCSGSGPQEQWLIAPSGEFNTEHPLSPLYPASGSTRPVPSYDEWADHSTDSGTGCAPQGINSRTLHEGRQLQTAPSSSPTDAPNGAAGGNGAKHHPFDFAYDVAGNVRFDGRFYYQYDGMNRLKDVFDVAWATSGNGPPTPYYRRAHFDYDGLGQMVKSSYRTHAPNTSGDLSNEDIEWTPRDMLGRPIGIWRQKPGTGGGERPCAKPYQMFGYHNTGFRGEGADDTRGILDCPAVRWRDIDGDGVFDEKLSYLQDFRGDVQALFHEKYGVMERVRYGPTGYPESFPASDINFDGIVDSTDLKNMQDAVQEYDKEKTHYDPRADLNRDGVVDGSDEGLFNDSYSFYSKYEGMWKLSSGPGLLYNINGDNAGLDNRFGWRGYWYDPHLQEYHVRNRVYDPRPGAWKQNDPLGFGAGDQNLYRYADGNYSTGYDPLGLDDDSRGQHGFWYYVFHQFSTPGNERVLVAQPPMDGNQRVIVSQGIPLRGYVNAAEARANDAYARGDAFAQAQAMTNLRVAQGTTGLQQPLNVALVYAWGTVIVVEATVGTWEGAILGKIAKLAGSGVRALVRVGGKWVAELANGSKYELRAEEAAALEAKASAEARLAGKGEQCGEDAGIARWGPATGEGPLGSKIANTFRGGSYTERVLEEDTILYRVYSDPDKKLGGYWTTVNPAGPQQAVNDLALLPEWGNRATNVVEINVPAGTRVYEGIAAPQGNLMGGGSQVFLRGQDMPGGSIPAGWIQREGPIGH